MTSLLQQLGVALVAAFILWAASKVFYQRRLFYVVQNLFDHSTLSDGGTVEIVIANLGRRAEEDVQLELVPGLRYELVAATSPNVSIDDSRVIKIPRLAPSQQLTLLILAEGSQRFGANHITSLTSKDVVGKSAKNMAEATASDPFAVAVGIVIFFSLAGLLAGGGYFIGKEDGKVQAAVEPQNKEPAVDQKFSLGCADFLSNGDKSLSDDALKGLASMSVEVRRVFRRGDNVGAEVEIKNPAGVETSYSVSLKSPAADSSTRVSPNGDSFIYDITLLEKNATKSVVVENYLPDSFRRQVFWIEVRLEVTGGYWVNYKRRVSFGRDSALQCPLPSDQTA